MWDKEYDADYKDEKQSKYYSKLSGAKETSSSSESFSDSSTSVKESHKKKNKKSKKHNRTSPVSSNENDWLVPDLSKMTDEEFQKRLENLRSSHNETLKLCDDLGIKASKKTSILKIPKAEVDFDYVLRSHKEITSSESDSGYKDITKLAIKPPIHKSKKFKNNNSKLDTFKDEGRKYDTSHIIKHRKNNLSKSNSMCNLNDTDDACSTDGCMLSKYAHRVSKNKLSDYKGKYTIPEPFNLTPYGLRKSISFVKFEEDLEKRRTEEEAERRKKIKPKGLPSDVYDLKLNQMQRYEEQKRNENFRARSQFFSTVAKPFDFIEREKEKKAMKALQKSMMDIEYDNEFKAKPYPHYLFGKDVEEKTRDEAWRRWIASSQRAEQMLKNSKLPKNMTKARRSHVCSLSCDDHKYLKPQHTDYREEYESSQTKNLVDLSIDKRIQLEIEAELRTIKV